MGRKGMGVSAIAIGAVTYWSVTTPGIGFRLAAVGAILTVVGGLGFVASAVVFGASREPDDNARHSYDCQEADADGPTTAVYEEVR